MRDDSRESKKVSIRPMILIPPPVMPPVEGVVMPHELYWVANAPAPLAGMRFPRAGFPWQALGRAGFVHVVRLASAGPAYNPHPLNRLHTSELEDLVHAAAPADPARELRLIQEATAAVVGALTRGEGVVVHCMGGRGRTGTVLGAVLVELGLPYAQVIAYLDEVHKLRGTSGWPESPWQADVLRRFVPDPRAGDSSSAKALRK